VYSGTENPQLVPTLSTSIQMIALEPGSLLSSPGGNSSLNSLESRGKTLPLPQRRRIRGGPVKALNTGRRRGVGQQEEGDGRKRTDCETAISRLVQVRDRLVAGAGDVEVPGLSRGDKVEDVVAYPRTLVSFGTKAEGEERTFRRDVDCSVTAQRRRCDPEHLLLPVALETGESASRNKGKEEDRGRTGSSQCSYSGPRRRRRPC
jgi:hypothetical protein